MRGRYQANPDSDTLYQPTGLSPSEASRKTSGVKPSYRSADVAVGEGRCIGGGHDRGKGQDLNVCCRRHYCWSKFDASIFMISRKP